MKSHMKTVAICLIIITLSLLVAFPYLNYKAIHCKPIERDPQMIKEDNAIQFLEVFSMGNRLSAEYLNNFAEYSVVNKFSSAMGDTERGMNYPVFYSTYWKDDDTLVITFDPRIHDYVDLYTYQFTFNKNNNKIGGIKTDYLYRGDVGGAKYGEAINEEQ